MIRIGILGAAKIAPKAVIGPASTRADCEVVAVAARDAQRAQAYAEEHGIPHIADSYEALLARDDIDLIYNALPPHRHADLTVAALEAGKAVLCEKPFAMNAVEAARMVEASARTAAPSSKPSTIASTQPSSACSILYAAASWAPCAALRPPLTSQSPTVQANCATHWPSAAAR